MSINGISDFPFLPPAYKQEPRQSIEEKRGDLIKTLEKALIEARERATYPVSFQGNDAVETAIEVIPIFAPELITDENREYHRWSSEEAIAKTLDAIQKYKAS